MSKTRKKNDKKLTERQMLFCREYMVDLNGTKAAIRAGYSAQSARSMASDLLTLPNVQAFLSELRTEQQQRLDITADRVLNELAKIGFSDVRGYLTETGRIAQITQLPQDITPAISEVRTETRLVGEEPVEFTRFKLHDKVGALTLIGKHLGMFKESIDANVTTNVIVTRRIIHGNQDANDDGKKE